MKAIEIQAPNTLYFKEDYITLFLAGSIQQGEAIEWQRKIIKSLSNKKIIFFNPRRDNWDSSWKQEMNNDKFREQVEWELNGLEKADYIVLFFDKNTQSPISSLELGLHANSGKMIVYCPEGFYRKGNVDIVCDKYGITQVESFEELIDILKILNLKQI